jgi:hypothetical protein
MDSCDADSANSAMIRDEAVTGYQEIDVTIQIPV